MKRIYIFVLPILILVTSVCAVKTINSGVYEWQKLLPEKSSSGLVREILKDPTRSLDMFEIKAVTLKGGKSLKEYTVATYYDEFVIIKEGSIKISINNEINTLETGSIAVAPQGSKILISNPLNIESTFYLFRLKPRQVAEFKEPAGIISETPPVFIDWNSLKFKPTANGGRRDIMRQPASV